MTELDLRPMTEGEYQRWRAHSFAHYVAEKIKSGLDEETARAEGESAFQRNLSQGRETPGQHLYTVRAGGTEIGILWWAAKPRGEAWIYDIELQPAARGQGFGRKLMEWAMADAKAKGCTRLGLHVFGHNKVARKLYESLGFEPTNIVMAKALI